MKKVIIITSLILASIEVSSTKEVKIKTTNHYNSISKYSKTIKLVGTIYYPVEGQCDSDPLVTADMTKVDPNRIKEQRIVALSRNLLKRWGGKISYGDTILVSGGVDKEYLGEWYVHDTMNKRYTNYLDFMVPTGTKLAKFDSLTIKVKR